MAAKGTTANAQQWAELAAPNKRPNWDYNTEEGRGHLERFWVAILQSLKRRARKPMNMTKSPEVIQRETKSSSEFYKRLCEAYRLYMSIDPEAAGSQMVINAAFVSQAYPDIRCKFQKVEGILAMTSSQIIEIADRVFRNRDVETKRKVEKRQREDNKRAGQRVTVLAAAPGRSLPRPSLPPLNQNQPTDPLQEGLGLLYNQSTCLMLGLQPLEK